MRRAGWSWRAGTRVNPLDTVPLRQRLVFLDGDDPAQVAWAMGRTTALNAKLILVRGSPFALMKAEQRRFYFDQSGHAHDQVRHARGAGGDRAGRADAQGQRDRHPQAKEGGK